MHKFIFDSNSFNIKTKYTESYALKQLRTNDYRLYLKYMKDTYDLNVQEGNNLYNSEEGPSPAYNYIKGFFIDISYKHNRISSDGGIAGLCDMTRKDFRELLKLEYNAIEDEYDNIYFLNYADCQEAIKKVIMPAYICNKLLENA